jgi:hypothetical protein
MLSNLTVIYLFIFNLLISVPRSLSILKVHKNLASVIRNGFSLFHTFIMSTEVNIKLLYLVILPWIRFSGLFPFRIMKYEFWRQSVGIFVRKISPPQARYLRRATYTQKKRRQTSMPRMEFEPRSQCLRGRRYFVPFFSGLWGYWHCGHYWLIVPASGDSEDDCGEADGMSIGRGNRSSRRKPAPAPLLSITKSPWPDPGLNLGRRGGKPATNRLSYGAAYFVP